MTLPWVRLDTSMPRNHKILAALPQKDGYRAAFVYCCSLAHSGEQGTAGFIPEEALPFVHARRQDAARLVELGLWEPVPGGWVIPDWAEFQPTTEQHVARSEKAKKASAARWAKARSNAPSNAPSNAQNREGSKARTDGRTDVDLSVVPPLTDTGFTNAHETTAASA